MRSVPFIVLSVIALGFLAQNHLPGEFTEEADGIGELRATIVFDSMETNVKVDPQRGGIATYTGIVTTTQPRDADFQFGIIKLNATCTGGWDVTDIPIMTVTRSNTVLNFSVSVYVPPFTRSSEMSEIQKIIVQGQWTYEPGFGSGEIEPAEAFVNVDPFYQYAVRCEPGYVQTSPGGEFDLELLIENTGNIDDEIEVEIEGRDRKENNGWAFIMDITNYDIPRGETVKVPVTIITPKRWDGWRNVVSVIRFQVTSTKAIQNNDVSEVASYSLYIRQRGVAVPGFEVPVVMLAIISLALLSQFRRR